MAIVSRLGLNHPALGTAGGASLHASIEALYTKLGDNINTRWFHIIDFDQGETVDLEHNFEMDISNISFDFWSYVAGEWTRITSQTTPARSAFTVAEKVGFVGTILQITNNTGGDNLTFAVSMKLNDLRLDENDIGDIDITTVAPEDGQALVFDNPTKKFKPGASGDSSFKIQSVATPNAVIKGGFMLLDDGRELATFATNYGDDLTVSLTAILGSAPADATTYYLYVNLDSLGAEQIEATTGRRLFKVEQAQFTLLTAKNDLEKYAFVGLVRSATTGNVWSGTGSAFKTQASRVFTYEKPHAITNLLPNSKPEQGSFGWSTYKDAAGVSPVDGTGGSPTTLTLTEQSTFILNGRLTWKLAKSAANGQGEGISQPFPIKNIHKNKLVGIQVAYASDLAYSSDDLRVYIYDVDNATLITPSTVSFGAIDKDTGNTVLEASFLSSNSANYRLCFHVASTNASAWDFYFTDVAVLWSRKTDSVLAGWKVYTSEVTYSSTPAGWSLTGHSFIPYKDPITKKWRLRFNIDASQNTSTSSFVTLNGVTFKTGINQACSAITGGATYASRAYASGGTGNIVVGQATGTTAFTCSGDVELDGKPTWADFEGSINLLDNSVLYSNARFASYGLTTNQSIPSATETVVTTWNTPSYNTGFTYSTGVVTFTASGYYRVFAQIRFSGTITTTLGQISILNSAGSTVYAIDCAEFSSAQNPTLQVAIERYFNAGDTVKISAYHEVGSSVNLVSTSHSSMLNISRIPDISANAPLGYGIADSNNAGLAQAGNLPASLSGLPIAAGRIGERIEGVVVNSSVAVSGGNLPATHFFNTNPLSKGTYIIDYYIVGSGFGGSPGLIEISAFVQSGAAVGTFPQNQSYVPSNIIFRVSGSTVIRVTQDNTIIGTGGSGSSGTMSGTISLGGSITATRI